MKTFFASGNCPIRDIISNLGDKWSLLVLITLKVNGTMRFSDIHRSIEDVFQRMLTVTLRSLESDGLVSREIFPEVPPRVEYQLTELGSGLIPHVQNLVNVSYLYSGKNNNYQITNHGQQEKSDGALSRRIT